MEAAAGIHDDWELLVFPDTSSGYDLESSESAEAAAESADANDGALKSDYFALDSDGLHREAAAFDSDSFEDDRVQFDHDSPGLLNQGTDSRFLPGSEGEPGFAGNELSRRESGDFVSPGSLDGQRSRLGSEKGFTSDEASDDERSRLGSEKGFTSDEASDGQRSCLGSEKGFTSFEASDGQRSRLGSEKGFTSFEASDGQRTRLGSEKGFTSDEASDGQRSCLGRAEEELSERVWEVPGIDAEDAKHEVANGCSQIAESCESPNFSSGIGDKRICPPGAKGCGMAWWKLPFQMLKFCAFRVKPIWSISVAAAMLGVWMLGRRLYCIKQQKRRSIPLKISFDEKKTSQLKVHAARLNEAFSVVKRAPMIRAQLPTGGFPLPVLGFQ